MTIKDGKVKRESTVTKLNIDTQSIDSRMDSSNHTILSKKAIQKGVNHYFKFNDMNRIKVNLKKQYNLFANEMESKDGSQGVKNEYQNDALGKFNSFMWSNDGGASFGPMQLTGQLTGD